MNTLTVFISSTVKDFGPVRSDLRTWLTDAGAVVRMSEDPEFPVVNGVTSHDACLEAIPGSHVVVVLIGDRRGGSYAGTQKSITRREYEEALRLGLPVIVLVREDVNKKAEAWGRKELREPPFGADTDHVIGFIDFARKGHTDNWIHVWDGSYFGAREIIQARLNTTITSLLGRHTELVRLAKRYDSYVDARLQLDKVLHALGKVDLPAREKALAC